MQRVDVAILPPCAQTPLVLSGASDPPSTSSSRGSPRGTAPQGSPGHTGAVAEERVVFQCGGFGAAAQSGGRAQGAGRGWVGEGREGDERGREREMLLEVEQALRTALLRLSTTQHSATPGAPQCLQLHSTAVLVNYCQRTHSGSTTGISYI